MVGKKLIMRIELDLPDWVKERNIYIVSALNGDIELATYKELGENWKVKDIRCGRCGDCCTKWINSPNPKEPCEHWELKDGKAYCKLDVGMPFNCVIGISKSPYITECVVTYKEIK